jgi:hypothetical protein
MLGKRNPGKEKGPPRRLGRPLFHHMPAIITRRESLPCDRPRVYEIDALILGGTLGFVLALAGALRAFAAPRPLAE